MPSLKAAVAHKYQPVHSKPSHPTRLTLIYRPEAKLKIKEEIKRPNHQSKVKKSKRRETPIHMQSQSSASCTRRAGKGFVHREEVLEEERRRRKETKKERKKETNEFSKTMQSGYGVYCLCFFRVVAPRVLRELTPVMERFCLNSGFG